MYFQMEVFLSRYNPHYSFKLYFIKPRFHFNLKDWFWYIYILTWFAKQETVPGNSLV